MFSAVEVEFKRSVAAAQASDYDKSGRIIDQPKKRSKVRNACVGCKKVKTACDEERPCRRCIRLGIEDQCIDAVARRKPSSEDEAPGAATYEPFAWTPDASLLDLKIPLIDSALVESSTGLAFPMTPDDNFPMSGEYAAARYLSSPPVVPSLSSFDACSDSTSPPATSAMAAPPAASATTAGEQAVIAGLFPPVARATADGGGGGDDEIARMLSPTAVMQKTFFTVLESLRRLRDLVVAGATPLRASLFRFLAIHMLRRAPAHGVPVDVVQRFIQELGLADLPPRDDSKDRAWFESSKATFTHVPFAVISVLFSETWANDVYVNEEAEKLFGYNNDEMRQLILNPREGFFLRVWHADDLPRVFSAKFLSLLRQTERFRTRCRFLKKNGQVFEAMFTSQFFFDADGFPYGHIMYITPVDDLLPELPASLQDRIEQVRKTLDAQ